MTIAQRIPRFCKALDDVPGIATDALDWRRRLGDEFDLVQPYLRNTGEFAREVDCPSPGGDGCPRRVVHLHGETWRAVCGSRDGQCDALDLASVDIAVHSLDRNRLAASLSHAFGVAPAATTANSRSVIYVGEYAVAAGVSSPVFLLLLGPQDTLEQDELHAAGVPPVEAIILLPRRASLTPVLRSRLGAASNHLVYLAEAINVDYRGRLGLQQPIELLFQPAHERLLARLKSFAEGPVIALPMGTTWEGITLTFTSRETLSCAAGGVTRQLDPATLGMRSEKNHKVTAAWTMLLGFAIANGRMADRTATKVGKIQKQKQELSRHLKRAFGLSDEPIPWNKVENAYVPRFVLRDNLSRSERALVLGRRNFVE